MLVKLMVIFPPSKKMSNHATGYTRFPAHMQVLPNTINE